MFQEVRKEHDLQQLLDYAARRQGWASLPARALRQQLAMLRSQKGSADSEYPRSAEPILGSTLAEVGC